MKQMLVWQYQKSWGPRWPCLHWTTASNGCGVSERGPVELSACVSNVQDKQGLFVKFFANGIADRQLLMILACNTFRLIEKQSGIRATNPRGKSSDGTVLMIPPPEKLAESPRPLISR